MQDDAELVGRVLGGETACFRALVRRYQDAVYAVALSRTGSAADAEDVAQESFLNAFERLGQLRKPERFGSWLYAIARNKANTHLRKNGAKERAESCAEARPRHEPPDGRALREETRASVMAALGRLSDANRETATLFYIDGYSQADVARFTNRPIGTIRRRLHDARKQLRKELVTMVEHELKTSRPGQEFADRVLSEITNIRMWLDADRLFFTDAGGRSFWLHVGPFLARTIGPWVEGAGSPEDTDIFTAAVRALSSGGCGIRRAVIESGPVRQFASLTVNTPRGPVDVGCRPGIAVNFAVRAGAPVLAESELAGKRSLKGKRGRPLAARSAWTEAQEQFRRYEGERPYKDVAAVLRALEKDPGSDQARHSLASCESETSPSVSRWVRDCKGGPRKLRQWVEDCRGTDLEAAAAGFVGAVCLYTSKNPDEAIPYLETSHGIRPDDEEVAFDLATAYTMADRTADAFRILRKSSDWHTDITKPAACGNFRKLWSDRRFRAIVGEPDPRCERFLCMPQLRILATTGPDPVPRAPGPWGQECKALLAASDRLVSSVTAQSDTGPLLGIRAARRVVASGRHHVVLETSGNRAAMIRVPKGEADLVWQGFVPFADRQPEVPLTVHQVLDAAGCKLRAVVLLKRGRRGIEGALATGSGRRPELSAVRGLHGLAVALAAGRPVLIAESLAEKLYVRGKSGRPLSPAGARRKLKGS